MFFNEVKSGKLDGLKPNELQARLELLSLGNDDLLPPKQLVLTLLHIFAHCLFAIHEFCELESQSLFLLHAINAARDMLLVADEECVGLCVE